MTFHQQIILAVLDKGLIASLLAIAGFWLNRYIDAFKSRRALENELLRTRDQKQIQFLESQLSQLFWPLYLRLQTDNVVWERILQRKSNDPTKAALGKQVELDVLLPNHEAACKIIQDNIHLAADATLVKILLKYIKHVTIYRAIRATGDKETDPIDVGEPWHSSRPR